MDQDFTAGMGVVRGSSGYAALRLPPTPCTARGPCEQQGEGKEKGQISPGRAEQGPGFLNPETKYFPPNFVPAPS